MLRIALAVLHLLALGIGLGAVISRGRSLREPPTAASLSRAFRDDTMWGIAAGLWLVTGLWRLFAGTEKATGYYLANHVFYAKMGLFALIFVLELWPMITLIRWRSQRGAGRSAEEVAQPNVARRIATISHVQALLIVGMVIAAAMMARGYGARP
ncbi:MAG: rane protein [Gemmatimonadetes bacterium]|nr:rane protein [Gemmatimonadota bacterium]